MPPLILSKQTARRFVLGRQGLWPGRRWRGKEGVAQAARVTEAVQLDPLNVVARSQDLFLHSRVLEYQPDLLDTVAYTERGLFDYGGTLFLYPMEELPYWVHGMRARRTEGRWAGFEETHPEALAQVRAILQEGGPLGNRELEGNMVVKNYRGRKDTSLALFYLWITGEVMIHHRRGFERYYHLRERVAPVEWSHETTPEDAEAFFARKAVAFHGMVHPALWANTFWDAFWRPSTKEDVQRRLDTLVAEEVLAPVRMEGSRMVHYVLASDLPLLHQIAAGEVPSEWAPLESTTLDEVAFLAPLDIVSARGRAAKLFDFDYVWEVYKPAHARRWGYYTLPILYGDRLVARMDPRLERKTGTLLLNGFWLEEDAPLADPAFADALAKGLARFAQFLQAKRIDLSVITPPALQDHLRATLKGS